MTTCTQDKFGKHFCRRSYACSRMATAFYASNKEPVTATAPAATAASVFATMSQEERAQVRMQSRSIILRDGPTQMLAMLVASTNNAGTIFEDVSNNNNNAEDNRRKQPKRHAKK